MRAANSQSQHEREAGFVCVQAQKHESSHANGIRSRGVFTIAAGEALLQTNSVSLSLCLFFVPFLPLLPPTTHSSCCPLPGCSSGTSSTLPILPSPHCSLSRTLAVLPSPYCIASAAVLPGSSLCLCFCTQQREKPHDSVLMGKTRASWWQFRSARNSWLGHLRSGYLAQITS